MGAAMSAAARTLSVRTNSHHLSPLLRLLCRCLSGCAPGSQFKRGELWVAGKYDVLAVAARAIHRIGPWYASRVLAEGQSTSRHGRAVRSSSANCSESQNTPGFG